MKNIALTFFIVFSSISSTYAQEWLTDLETAKTKATKEQKAIILVFQGSDWCAPCMKLEKKIWNSPEFISQAPKDFIFLKADFPRKKKNALPEEQASKNNLLAETYNKNGYFPLVVILDSNGKNLGQTGYNKLKPTEYLESLVAFIK